MELERDSEARASATLAPLACIECLRPWLDGAERWHLKLTDDPVPEAVPYCPECERREFGP
jgi:hypothetical protein